MNILLIGLGSMGRRRAGLLKDNTRHTLAGVDLSHERRKLARETYGMETFVSVSEVIASGFKPEAAFICMPPLLHGRMAVQMLELGCHVFTEINLVSDGYEEIKRLSREKGLVFFLSSTFNYRKDIAYVQNRVRGMKGPAAYTYHVGQYLPDWHPWESYRDFFVAEKRTNAVRELMGIDLPWLCGAFGDITHATAAGGNVSGLELGYPDYRILILTHDKGHRGSLCFDVAARAASRRLEVMGEDTHILWEGRPDKLYDYLPETGALMPVSVYEESVAHREGYHPMIVENAYLDEIRCFLGMVEGKGEPKYTLDDDEKIIRWMDEIEGNRAE